MKIGRNEPCPCGSGKKYKKCCLAKDGAAARAPRLSPATREAVGDGGTPEPSSGPAGPRGERRDPERERWKRFWTEFTGASLDERLAMARRTIEETDDLDGELAFDLVEGLVHGCQKSGQTAELERILDLIAQRHPETYAEEAHWFLGWQVENALVAGGDLVAPLLALAAHADRAIDQLFPLIDRLMYHGREKEILEALVAAWPPVRDSDEIIDHGKIELQEAVLNLLVDRHLARAPNLAANDPAFLAESEPYREGADFPWWNNIIELRTGRHEPVWSRAHFACNATTVRFGCSVFELAEQLAVALEKQHGWPRTRAVLAREVVFDFLLWRGEEKASSRKAKKGSGASASPFSSLVTPDGADEFVAGQVGLFRARPHRAAAFAQALPHLLSLLAEKGLLDAGEARHLDGALRKRFEPLGRVLERLTYDPMLAQDMREATERPAEEIGEIGK